MHIFNRRKILTTLMILICTGSSAFAAGKNAKTCLFDLESGLAVPDTKGNLDAYLGVREIASSVPVYSNLVKFPYKNNHSLQLDGKDFGTKAFSIPATNIPKSPAYTVEAWFKPNRKLLQYTRLWSREGVFSLTIKYGEKDCQRLLWSVNINGKDKKMATPLNKDVFGKNSDWVHIAASYDGKNGVGRIFVNGAEVVKAFLGKNKTMNESSDLTVGNRSQADRGFVGLLDEFRYSPKALNSGELGFSKTLFTTAPPKQVSFEWENSKCGISDKVPARWQAVKAKVNQDKSIAITAAGKKFIFSNSVFPDQIKIGNIELLASPARLIKDGKNCRNFKSDVKLASHDVKKAVLTGNLRVGNQLFNGRCEIEFDGLCRLTLHPVLDSPRPKVASCRLLFPLNPRIAKLGKVGGFAGEIKEKKGKSWTFPLWVGNEDAGLCMFTDTNQFWVNPKAREAFTVEPEKTCVAISANFITTATVFKPDSKFEIFFQPTPVTEFPRKRNELGNFHGAFINMEKVPSAVNLTYPAAGCLNPDAGTMDIVFEAAFDPNAKIKKLLGREPYIREIFTVATLGHEKIRLAWSIPHGGFIVDEGIQPSATSIWDGTWKTLFVSQFSGKVDTPYHLTLTWGKQKIKLYLNGRLLAEHPRKGLFSAPINPDSMGKAKLRFGESIFNFLTPRFGAGFKIDAIRILDHEVQPVKTSSDLKKVAGTILLDRFESTEKQNGEIITRPRVGSGGRISTGGKVVNNKVQLFQDKNDVKASCLDRVHDSGVNTIIFHQGWSSIQSHYTAAHPVELRQLIEACHKKQMKILLYFGFELSDKAPEFHKYHRQALRLNPDRPTPKLYKVRHDQKSQTVCYGGDWQNFITFAINKTLDDFKCDGIFIDAAMVPYPCPNELHGCGWRDSAGKLHATQPTYNYIKMIRRIHNIVKARGGTITGNQATFPLWPYCDSVWMGEGYRYKQLGENPVKGIPLHQWRILFDGKNLGRPGELLMYEYPENWRRDAAWMLAGLHNMYVRPEIWWTGAYLEKVLEIRKAIRKYASANTEFMPYWKKQVPVTANSRDVLISAWQSPDGMLLWLGNTSGKQVKSDILLKPAISGKVAPNAFDPIFKNKYAIKNNHILLTIEPFNFRVLYLKFNKHPDG